MKIKINSLIDFFSANSRELRSLLFLIPTIILLLYSHQFYNLFSNFFNENKIPSEVEFHYSQSCVKVPFLKKPILNQQKVNPNHLNAREWESMGFSSKISDRIVKYRLKGGQFYNTNDLYKIYAIDSSLVISLQDHFIFNSKKLKSFRKVNPPSSGTKKDKVISISLFDPNIISKKELEHFNLPHKIVKSLINYRENGGVFYEKNDLLKLYGMDSSIFFTIKDSIVIGIKKEKIAQITLNLNTVGLEELVTIKGIGKARAQHILDYKKKLGGSFYSLTQLLEVYSIDSVLYQEVSEYLYLETQDLQKIFINKVTYEELATHPYLSYRQAKWIIKYRKQHGNYENTEDILKIKTINKEDIESILPYLDFRH